MDYIFSKSFFFKNIHRFKKTCQWFYPRYLSRYFVVFISFVRYFGIIIKERCSLCNEGIIQQPIVSINKVITRGGSRISEEGVQMLKRGVRLPYFNQNVLKFPMKMEEFGSRGGFERTP